MYLNSDRSKLQKRDRYIVTSIQKDTCEVQKFTGSQLRARSYNVNRSDILAVRPWIFKDDDNENSSPNRKPNEGREADTTVQADHRQQEDEGQEEVEYDNDDEEDDEAEEVEESD